jgi:thiamine pyrophosphate-dependent acetolactate synthase large subunit-like protein
MRNVLDVIGDDLVVCNQGGNSQDWHELRPHNNFYLQHAMGLTTAIALGLALAQPTERVWSFEGDGGILMNLGLLGVVAKSAPPNLRVVIFDNGNHECGGPYPTLTVDTVDLDAVGRACGLNPEPHASNEDAFRLAIEAMAGRAATGLVVAAIELGTDGSPMTIDAVEGKFRFVRDVERKLGLELIHPPEYYSTTF